MIALPSEGQRARWQPPALAALAHTRPRALDNDTCRNALRSQDEAFHIGHLAGFARGAAEAQSLWRDRDQAGPKR